MKGQVTRLRMKLTRHTSLLSLLGLIVGCSNPDALHVPISEKTRQRLDHKAINKQEFLNQVSTQRRPKPTQAVTVPFRMNTGVPVFKAGINYRTGVPMLLDTGASRSLIQANIATKHGVTVMRAEDATVAMQGVVGKEVARVGLLNPLEIGSWEVKGYPCIVRMHENWLNDHYSNQGFPETLLGFDIALEHCSYLTLDYKAEKATFAFAGSFQPEAGKNVAKAAFRVMHGVPMITLKSGGKSWEAIVDTGSFNGIEIDETTAKLLGVQDQGEVVRGLYLMGVGGTISSTHARLRTLKLNDLTILGDTFREAQVDISPGPPRVGSFFLKDYRATFDIKRKTLWLEW